MANTGQEQELYQVFKSVKNVTLATITLLTLYLKGHILLDAEI